MKINFSDIPPYEPSQREQWMEQARSRLLRKRQRRARELSGLNFRKRLSRARSALGEISAAGSDPGTVVVRPAFARNLEITPELERAMGYDQGRRIIDGRLSPSVSAENPRLLARTVEVRNSFSPPMVRLAHRSPLSASLYLSALLVGNCLLEPGSAWENKLDNVYSHSPLPSWSEVLGQDRDELSRRRIVKCLVHMDKLDMVSPRGDGESRGRWSRWLLLSETGDGKPYRVPSDGLHLPIGFFLEGWHLALTPAELACYLTFQAASSAGSFHHREGGIGLSRRNRIVHFGLTDEAYTCVNELVEYGLLSRRPDTVEGRRGGKVAVDANGRPNTTLDVYRFDVRRISGDRAAEDEIANKLSSESVPRLEEFDSLAVLFQE